MTVPEKNLAVVQNSVVPVKRKGRPPKKETLAPAPVAPPVEKQIHKDAFQFYFDLGGAARSYQAVAEKFGVSVHYVRFWAKRYSWNARVSAIENRTVAEVIEDLDQKTILERFKMMWMEDPDKPGVMVLNPDYASVNAIKELTTAHVNLDRNSRDRVLDAKEGGNGAGGSRNRKSGITVNVNILNKTVPNPGT